MSRLDDMQRVLHSGIVAIIRSKSSTQLVEVAKALVDGGIDVLEVTLTVPNALQIIADVRKELGDKILLGAGTVLDPETARAALLAGAEFIVSPTLNLDVIRMCRRYDKLIMPGAFSPTEILTAWEAGADIIKVFPADVLGPAYLKAVKAPLPQVLLLPTGGVNLETMPAFFNAGACAVGLGGSLIEQKAIDAGDFKRIRSLAEQYLAMSHKCRKN